MNRYERDILQPFLQIFTNPDALGGLGSLSLCPRAAKRGQSETLLNTCIAHSNSADLLLFNNASDWLSRDFDNKSQ